MVLNYSKWDALELSDDSDTEVHPNVDTKSFIRWKQSDIHRQRAERKAKINHLEWEIKINNILHPRVNLILDSLKKDGIAPFQRTVKELKENPSPEKPETGAEKQPTFDDMLLSLLLQVWDGAKEVAEDKKCDKMIELLQNHETALGKRTVTAQTELESEIKEQKKHITSDDIHDGFDKSSVNKVTPPPPPPPSKKKTTKTTHIETINSPSTSADVSKDSGDESDEEEVHDFSETLQEFSRIDVGDFAGSLKNISQHPDITYNSEKKTDALLVEAFSAGMIKDLAKAKKCVCQGLILQYIDKLGKDGVSLFFRRMSVPNSQASSVFLKDVEETYTRIITRAAVVAEEKGNTQEEQIQLVSENPDTVISFNVPEGPAPAEIELEGEAAKLDVEQVRAYLDKRWEIFSSFSKEMREALIENSLDSVNKVLGSMKCEDAQQLVARLDEGGILQFGEGGSTIHEE